MLNKIVIVGRITKQPELIEKEELSYVHFNVATERHYKYQGENKSSVDYIFCKAYGKTANNIAEYTQKGTLVGICGYMRSSKYEKDGQTHFVMELIVETIKFIASPFEQTDSKELSSNQIIEGGPAFELQ